METLPTENATKTQRMGEPEPREKPPENALKSEKVQKETEIKVE